MAQQLPPLPEFDNPPVSEVVFSVQFTPLEKWRSPHGGMYWSVIQSDYPNTETLLPLSPQIEKFGEEFWERSSGVAVQLVKPDITRFWFLDAEGVNLIQVQQDRFIINWRRVKGTEVYPRYKEEIRPRFEREWARFREFLAESNIGVPEVSQCEVTYVNDIPIGEGEDAFTESLSLFSPWWGEGSESFLPRPEVLTVSGTFQMPQKKGRLRFTAQHMRRRRDNASVVQLRLVARGKPNSNSDEDVMKWMDLGREWIVRGFTDLTSPEAHKKWGRKC